MGISLVSAAFANNPVSERDELVISSIDYIEEDTDFELGFDTAEYLPEDFDPYKMYVDLKSVVYIEEEEALKLNTKKHLPKEFDAYAFPSNVFDFNYIDANDEISLNFDTQEHLPEGFNPYIKR
ncbi:MAG: hypothetical protein CML05_03310 [Pseudozobellia sp.]|nr:hypothetical protein [Pseudozobellia sp.]